MYLPFELFCVVAEAALARLIGTIAIAVGAGVLIAWSRKPHPVAPAGVAGGGLLAARPGTVSVAQLGAMLAGFSAVLAGLFLWTR